MSFAVGDRVRILQVAFTGSAKPLNGATGTVTQLGDTVGGSLHSSVRVTLDDPTIWKVPDPWVDVGYLMQFIPVPSQRTTPLPLRLFANGMRVRIKPFTKIPEHQVLHGATGVVNYDDGMLRVVLDNPSIWTVPNPIFDEKFLEICETQHTITKGTRVRIKSVFNGSKHKVLNGATGILQQNANSGDRVRICLDDPSIWHVPCPTFNVDNLETITEAEKISAVDADLEDLLAAEAFLDAEDQIQETVRRETPISTSTMGELLGGEGNG